MNRGRIGSGREAAESTARGQGRWAAAPSGRPDGYAGDKAKAVKIVPEAVVKMISDLTHGESAPGASQGLAPHPGQIASTYRRRFEELKVRFNRQGSTILVGEADA